MGVYAMLAFFAITSNDRNSPPATGGCRVAKEATHIGKVVSITGTKLVMTSKEGEKHSHALTAEAKVSCDGKVCKAEDLKAGTKIRVTAQTNDEREPRLRRAD